MKTKLLSVVALFVIIFAGNVQAQDYHFSYNYSRYAPLGLSFGYMPQNFGGYVSMKFGMGGVGPDTEVYTIDQSVEVGGYEKMGRKRSSYSGGVMVRLIEKLAIYGGAGYGTYGEAWGEEDAEDATVVINQFEGPECEVGFMFRGEDYLIGLGGIFMNGTNVSRKAQMYDISVQLGFIF